MMMILQVGLDDFVLLGSTAVMQELPPTPLARAAKVAQQQAKLVAQAVALSPTTSPSSSAASSNNNNNNNNNSNPGGGVGGLGGGGTALAMAEAAAAKAEAAAVAEATNNRNMSKEPKDIQVFICIWSMCDFVAPPHLMKGRENFLIISRNIVSSDRHLISDLNSQLSIFAVHKNIHINI
jgi:hypothetical protein